MGALLVVADQLIKFLVKTRMGLGESFDVLGDWFKICFVENEGMAFGMSFGGAMGKYLLSSFRIILFVALTWWISRLARKDTPTGVLVGLTLIDVGALGNIIDCLFYGLIFSASVYGGPVAELGGSYAPFLQGKVVDMFYFPLIDTYIGGKHITFFDPVFNLADSCVTVGAFYLILFKWKFFKELD